MGFPKDDDPIEAFLFHGSDEALGVPITVGRLKRRLHDANTRVGQGSAECDAPFHVPITNEDPVAAERAVIDGDQHARDLAHEGVVGCGVDPTRCTRRDASSMTKSV